MIQLRDVFLILLPKTYLLFFVLVEDDEADDEADEVDQSLIETNYIEGQSQEELGHDEDDESVHSDPNDEEDEEERRRKECAQHSEDVDNLIG